MEFGPMMGPLWANDGPELWANDGPKAHDGAMMERA
jgi:hypothetical protein